MTKKRYGNELHPLYSRWLSMTQRCTNPNHKQYMDWGGRGISICLAFQDFKTYAHHVENLPNYNLTATLDRLDNSKGYHPGNLRWASYSVQISNQRSNSRGFNRFTGVSFAPIHQRWVARVTFKGKDYCTSTHLTEEAAVEARNICITTNKLPHPIQYYTKEK